MSTKCVGRSVWSCVLTPTQSAFTFYRLQVLNLSGSILILAGPPGAGKSTTARNLVASCGPAVHLHSDDFWHFIRKGAIPPYLSGGSFGLEPCVPAKKLSGANAFEISDHPKPETEGALTWRSGSNNLALR